MTAIIPQFPRRLHGPRQAALITIAALVAAASAASFAESYRALYIWAAGHGLSGSWAMIWPLQVDVFIAVGELALFVGLIDQWQPRTRAAAWAVTGAGLAASIGGNIGHVASHALTARATAAVPPLAAAAALAVGLGVLKRVVAAAPAGAGNHEVLPAPRAAAPEGKLLTGREVAAMFRVDPRSVLRWRAAGKIAAIRAPGGEWRYTEASVLACLGPQRGQLAGMARAAA